jgi:hypothetical protein
MMNVSSKKVLQYVLFLGIGFALLYLTFKNVNPTELWANIQSVDTMGLLVALGIGFIAIIIRGIRWVQLLRSLGYNVTPTRAISAVAFSYLVNLVTPRVGEVARCTALNKTDQIPIDKLFGTVVLERVVDSLMFGLVVLITFITQAPELLLFLEESGASLPELNTGFFIVAGVVLFSIGAVLFLTKRIWLNWGFIKKIHGFVSGIIEGLKSIQKVDNKILFWTYSFAIWICYVGTIVVGFHIVEGLGDLGIGQAFYVSVAAALGFVVPVPGGLGAYHYLVSKALVVLGYTPELGTGFATIIHSGQSLMFVITGAIGMVILYFARKT